MALPGKLTTHPGRALKGPPTMDRSALPPAIVAPIDTFVRDLIAWATQHRDADLAMIETVVRDHLRALAPQLVGGMISVTQRSLDPGQQRDRPGARSAARLGACAAGGDGSCRPPVDRSSGSGPGLSARPAGQCWSPTDRTLGVPPQQRSSTSLQAWLVSLGTLLPFATAGAQLATLTGVRVSAETLRRLTEAAGQALDAQLQEDAATVDRTKGPSAQSIRLGRAGGGDRWRAGALSRRVA